jgi:hypothetical protein
MIMKICCVERDADGIRWLALGVVLGVRRRVLGCPRVMEWTRRLLPTLIA